MDELVVRVEVQPSIYEQGGQAVAGFRKRTERDLQRVLGVRAKVDVVEPNTIARTDFKARRVIDDRDLFRKYESQTG